VGYETFTTFHPTVLYESLWDACVLLGLLWLIPRVLGRVRAGTLFITYLAAYAAGRLVLESMRVDFAHHPLGLRVNQWVFGTTFLFAAPTGALLLLRSRGVLRGSE
jgi:prolipoprotein diacylglyceryltransferase